MNRIKLIFTIMILSSCDKSDDLTIPDNQFVRAGQVNENILLQDFNPEKTIKFINESVEKSPTTVYSGELKVDLDLDGIDDVNFYSYYGYGCSSTDCFKPTIACELISMDNKEVDVFIGSLQLNDPIEANLSWERLGRYFDSRFVKSTILSSYKPDWVNTEEEKYNPWSENYSFLPIRMRKKNTYKYGWIQIKIDDFYNLKIKQVGFEK